jgi:hypothetical protein
MRDIRHIHLAAVALAAAASLGVAACGGGSRSPGVASLSGAAHSTTTTTLPRGTPTQLLDEWASCMRQHGDPNQADPTIDSSGVIHIVMASTGSAPEIGKGSNSPCDSYLHAASIGLGGRTATERPSYSKLLSYSKCMRSHGIPDFPDPSPGGGLSLQSGPGSDLDPHSATFQSASKTCAKKTGLPNFGSGHPGPGSIEMTSGGPGAGPSGGPGGGSGSESVGIG